MDLKDKSPTIKWRLQSTSDPTNKWAFPIDSVPFNIGRDESCELTLESRDVSRYHAQLNVSGDMLWIRNSGSTNGTFINGRQIAESEELSHGDILHVGQVGFCVLCLEEERLPGDKEDENKTAFIDTSGMQLDRLASFTAIFKKMIRDRAVVPHFQPIRALSDNVIRGYEVLGRLPRSLKLPRSPVELFNLAVSLGMATELSSLFREEGVHQIQQLPDFKTLFVNTHPAELKRIKNLERSLEKIREMAASTTIVLEINEKAITDLGRMKSLKSALKNLDIGLAYDDFGVGQSRLVELAKFPPDFLKFDISLIRKIHLAPKQLHQLVATFLNMSQDLGAATIAEGVECREEAETCRQLGFDYAQGFHYGMPIPISKFDLPGQINTGT